MRFFIKEILMQEKKFVKTFRIIKIIELCCLSAVGLVFFLILVCNPSLSLHIYEDSTLLFLCGVAWLTILLSLFCLLYDFCKLKFFAEESHTLNKEAYLDDLTGIPNRHGLDTILGTFDSPESFAKTGCYMATIQNLQELNKTMGRETGDTLIQDFCNIFEEVGDRYGIVGRNSGNDFLLIMREASHEAMQQFIEELEKQINQYNASHTDAQLLIHGVYLLNAEEKTEVFSQFITETYNKLHH